LRIGMDTEMFGKAFAFVFVALVVGVFAARVADTRSKSAAASAAISAAPVSAPELRSNSRSVTLSRQWLPFWVEPKIDGRPLQMVVDTGATQIALRASDAARLGIHPTARDYVVKVATANGITRAALVRCARSNSAISWCAIFPLSCMRTTCWV
jgi:aspartyl protease family protein